MDKLQITFAAYCKNPMTGDVDCISATIDGITMSVPLDPNNRHYAAILKAVEEGTLVIQEVTA